MPKAIKRKNEAGNVYTRLTVVEFAGHTNAGQAKWLCSCICGGSKIVSGEKLRLGSTKSCGCWKRDHGRNFNKLTDQERIDRATKPRECSGCHQVKPPEAFGKIVRRRCVMCDKARERERRGPDYHRLIRLKSFYRITKEQYMAILESQNGLCAICHNPPPEGKELNMDHDHNGKKGDAGYYRGLLCSPCNMGLGHFGDDVERMLSAIAYLRLHKTLQNKSLTELVK